MQMNVSRHARRAAQRQTHTETREGHVNRWQNHQQLCREAAGGGCNSEEGFAAGATLADSINHSISQSVTHTPQGHSPGVKRGADLYCRRLGRNRCDLLVGPAQLLSCHASEVA